MTFPPPPLQASTVPAGPVPLQAPYYSAPFGIAVRRFFTKYATFSGRASRAEYWWWALVAIVISIALNSLQLIADGIRTNADGTIAPPTGGTVFFSVLPYVWALATLIPNLALTVRRLHDAGHSGEWILIGLVPLAGPIVLLVSLCTGPSAASARFDQPTS